MSGSRVNRAPVGWARVRAVLRKEFREYRRNKMILLTMVLLPIVFLVMPVIAALALPEDAPRAAVTGIAGQAAMFFFIAPLMLPTTIAAYSVIGEREQQTLEPVLTTPVTDDELLLGKAIAATVPSVLLSWALFGCFSAIVGAFASEALAREFLTAEHVASEAMLAPGLAGLAIVVGLAISARSSDIRVAQQLSGLVMMPALGGIAVISYGVVHPTVGTYATAAAVLIAVDVVGWRAVGRMFNRERILTRFGN